MSKGFQSLTLKAQTTVRDQEARDMERMKRASMAKARPLAERIEAAAALHRALELVEAATGPDMKLANRVCNVTMKYWGEKYPPIATLLVEAIGRGSVDAVVSLIEREMPDGMWHVGKDCKAWITRPGGRVAYGRGKEPALALLAAFLRAKLAEAEQRETEAAA